MKRNKIRITLVIIYNHQYIKNIEVIEKLYSGRFTRIFHLVPFYVGSKKNVIPVYESSFYFQGYIAQSKKHIFNQDSDHYLFVADDLILNPNINESNYNHYFGVDNESDFLPELISLHKRKAHWAHTKDAYQWGINPPGVEVSNLMPTDHYAKSKFRLHGLELKPLKIRQIWSNPIKFLKTNNAEKNIKNKLFKMLSCLLSKNINLPYPLVGGYSDICCISRKTLNNFTHYCGIFAATNLFVELAIPTALVLSSTKIITEEKALLKGKALWTDKDFEFLTRYSNSIDNLLTEYPEECLYIHPIKLSKWCIKE